MLDLIEIVEPGVRWLLTKLSAVRVGPDGVRVRNFPRRKRRIPLSLVDRFDWHSSSDGHECVLLLLDGSTVAVRGVDQDQQPGRTTTLNNEVARLRKGDR